jgi:AcrR family transcriptional regulator
MTKRSEDLDASRRQIIDAAVRVAGRSGLEALTMQAVAEQADVALRTIYNHFDSRESLIAAALGSLTDQTRAATPDIDLPDQPPREQLLAFVAAHLQSYEAQGDALRILMAALDVPSVAHVVSEIRAWRRQRLRRMIRDADRAGVLAIPAGDAVNVAYLATAYSTYATLVADAGLSSAAARSAVRAIVDRTLFGGH